MDYFKNVKLYLKPTTTSDGAQELEVKFICEDCGKELTADEIANFTAQCNGNCVAYHTAKYYCEACNIKRLVMKNNKGCLLNEPVR